MNTQHNLRTLRHFKRHEQKRYLQMLTCYDFQTAQLLDQTAVDMVLVGDSLGNVVLGYDHTVEVTLDEMILFGKATRRGLKQKFLVVDMPFGSYPYLHKAIDNAIRLFQETRANALKLEGAQPLHQEVIRALVDNGIPVMGHIGLMPQSVHQQGGFYRHGKDETQIKRLIEEAKNLEAAGVFAIVLECIYPEVAKRITSELSIPTIGIGAGDEVDGQVAVINDLFRMGAQKPPSFITPIDNFFDKRKELLATYFADQEKKLGANSSGNSVTEEMKHLYS